MISLNTSISKPGLIIIPCRLDSVRFPNKPLFYTKGQPLLQWVYDEAVKTDRLVIVTAPDKAIARECMQRGIPFFPSTKDCPSGTHRAAEVCKAAKNLGDDEPVIVWQVDEPDVRAESVEVMFDYFEQKEEQDPLINTFVCDMEPKDRQDLNAVKAAVSMDRCHWFSRLPLPLSMMHVGVYGFESKHVLMELATWGPSEIAEANSLEQLTWIEIGEPILPIGLDYVPKPINCPEDLDA